MEAPWPVIGSVLPVPGALYVLYALRRHRGKPGVDWFIVTLVTVVVWCLGYAVSLLVFDPFWRLRLEMLTWSAMMGSGISFLAFGLDYTGRGGMVRSSWFAMLVSIPIAAIGLIWTNPAHQYVWSDFRLDPVFGVATASYEFGAAAYLAVLIGTAFVTAGMLVLFEAVISYGPLFRKEALAVALSAVAPGIALLAWITEIGPYPQLNLTPLMFLPHVALDAYAFIGGDMFEFSPATRRLAQRRAIQDLDDPVVVTNRDERIVEFNPAAATAFDLDEETTLGSTIDRRLPAETTIDPRRSEQEIACRHGGEYVEYAVSSSDLVGPGEAHVGYVLVFRDVTDRRRRKQRLTVMNRVLRHNLRNDLNVVTGYIDLAIDGIDDEDAIDHLQRAQTDVQSLLDIGEKARDFERVVDALDGPTTRIDIATQFETIATHERVVAARGEPSEFELSIPADLELATVEPVFTLLFVTLVENGFEHSRERVPRVRIECDRMDTSRVSITVQDNGSGIPATELAAIEDGDETPLTHASGLGLWIVQWCTRALGGDLSFETGTEGTTVTVSLPQAGSNEPASTPVETVDERTKQADTA